MTSDAWGRVKGFSKYVEILSQDSFTLQQYESQDFFLRQEVRLLV